MCVTNHIPLYCITQKKYTEHTVYKDSFQWSAFMEPKVKKQAEEKSKVAYKRLVLKNNRSIASTKWSFDRHCRCWPTVLVPSISPEAAPIHMFSPPPPHVSYFQSLGLPPVCRYCVHLSICCEKWVRFKVQEKLSKRRLRGREILTRAAKKKKSTDCLFPFTEPAH